MSNATDRPTRVFARITDNMASGREVEFDVRLWRDTNIMIPDATARTIAGDYASPGAVGSVLASLATTSPVDIDALRDDIADTVRVNGESDALAALSAWADATWDNGPAVAAPCPEECSGDEIGITYDECAYGCKIMRCTHSVTWVDHRSIYGCPYGKAALQRR